MVNFIKTVLGAGITVGLSDRDAFVKQAAGIIEDFQKDPEKAEKWAGAVITYLENVRNNINMEHSIRNAMGNEAVPGKENIEQLTEAIKELTKTIQQKKGA